MNFSYGVIAAVGILVAGILGMIAMDPGYLEGAPIEPVSEPGPKAKPTVCTMEYAPVCGVDGITYGNKCMLDAAEVALDHSGECIVPEPVMEPEPQPEPVMEPEPQPEPVMEPEPITTPMPAGQQKHMITTAMGSSMPGCETTNECYIPSSISIFTGDVAIWENADSAAHTVTSGSPADGPDGIFDSGLFMSGSTFEFTFTEAGTYDYFCMVHPWMVGEVIVNDVKEMVEIESPEDAAMQSEPEPLPEPAQDSVPTSVTVTPAIGSGSPGCDETNECYLPYEVTIAVGGTVTWDNVDSAAHTVTSGMMPEGPTGIFDSGLFMSGSTFEFTFTEAGTYDYFCMVHPWMKGKVTVV